MIESLKRKLLYRLYRQSWNIGLTMHPVEVVAGLRGARAQAQALDQVRWMEESPGSFKADPFPAPLPNDPSGLLIFYEHFDWSSGKGRIDAVRWASGKYGRAEISLNSPHHLSYPYVYEEEGATFFMPEHAAAQNVALYAFSDVGRAISKKTVVEHAELVDASVIRHAGKYWLFATMRGDAVNRDLHVFHSESLLGPWLAHLRNPVKSDASNSRPAGQFFSYKGQLFRPAQNCSEYYGKSIMVNRVVTLSDEEFEEVTEAEIRARPTWIYDFGLHTISHLGTRTVIDAARLESTIHPALDQMSSSLRKREVTCV